MDWLEEVKAKQKRKNQILFSKQSVLLQDLMVLLEGQHRRAVVLWALELAEQPVRQLEERYGDPRPRAALTEARRWARGEIKMPQAKRAILDCHALAKEIQDPADQALCHGVGQACSTVHTPGHGIGLPIYELTALVYRHGLEDCRGPVEQRHREYLQRLLYWQEHWRQAPGPWAAFLCRSDAK